MAATELINRPAAVEETGAPELSAKVARQVSQILGETVEREPVPVRVPQSRLAYRVPSPGVRYYFQAG